MRWRYNQELEHLAELLFILASRDRLTLLCEIGVEKRRSSQLTAKLSATPQETSKHLARLRDAKLIEKDSEGSFGLTAFGKIIVNLLPSIRFLTEIERVLLITRYILSSPRIHRAFGRAARRSIRRKSRLYSDTCTTSCTRCRRIHLVDVRSSSWRSGIRHWKWKAWER